MGNSVAPDAKQLFSFRPWVRRAGLSILLVGAAVSLAVLWVREPFVWVYIATLLAGGAKVFLGTLRPIVEIDDQKLVLRPLHQLRATTIPWPALLGTEQTIGGDRLIVYHQTGRGLRFVALNLHLVKGRRDLLAALDERLRGMGFRERIVDRSRYLSRSGDSRFGIRDS